MKKLMTFHKKKSWTVFLCCVLIMTGLIGRLAYLMCFCSERYYDRAEELHERERDIKAARGLILDARGKVLASNRTVCTVSVIHSQIKNPEKVIRILAEKLGMKEEDVRKRVEKISSIERIKTNVDKSTGDAIRECRLDGVKVDEDYKRYYPYGSLASRVLGFTGGDNQGIIGLEVKYDEILKGKLPKQFMLNLLTTISSFSIIENANRTENIIAEMAGVLRYYLDNSSEIISLSEELKQIEAYLDVLRQQYDDRLEYRVYCQEEVEKQKIPIVGLFPFVEQLVDFGVFSGHFRGTLYIDAEKKEEYCQIVLQLESSGLSMGHFGADITDSNFVQMQEADIRKRYAKEFGKDFEITVDPNVVTVKIPFQQIK